MNSMRKTLLSALVVLVLILIVLKVSENRPAMVENVPPAPVKATTQEKADKSKIEITPESAAASAISALSAKGELNLDTSKEVPPEVEDAAVSSPASDQ